jgi:hypothetical protein
MPEIGPGSFRAVFGPLTRCLFLGMPPASKWWDFPVGLLNPWPSPCQSWLLPPEGDHLRAGLGILSRYAPKGGL